MRATLVGSGTILREVIAAAELLEKDFSIPADVFSAPSFGELRREALDCERWNMLHPEQAPRVPYVQQCFKDREGPVIAATDYMRSVPDQVRKWVAGQYVTLGTDGYGRSDSRTQLRKHFEVDRHFIVLAALKALADEGKVDRATPAAAIAKYGIDVDKPDPLRT